MVTVLVDGDTVETNDTNITNIELGNSYRCKSGNYYMLTGNDSTVQLTLNDLQLQAFEFINQTEFGKGLCFIYCFVVMFSVLTLSSPRLSIHPTKPTKPTKPNSCC